MEEYNFINKEIRKHREATSFYSFDELKKQSHNPQNNVFSHSCKYSELGKYETECIPVAHYYDENGQLQVVFSKEPTHCIGIGCTGAGKTTSLVIPKVNILASLKNKPSFFIVDVKGELYENLSGYLNKRGYNIQVLDLNEPEYSKSWNPFLSVFDDFTKAYELVDSVKEHTDNINDYPNLAKFAIEGSSEKWYEFDGVAISNITTLNKAISHKREKLLADVSGQIKDLAYMFITSSNKDDPHWDDSARDLFVGVIMAMLERTLLKAPHALTRDQFNLKNIIQIILSSSDEDLRRFINNSDRKGEAYRYANRLVNMQAEKTKSCYFGVLSSQLSAFKSYAIQKITIKNTIDFSSIAEKPTAIFMKMDDLKEANYSIAQLIVLRLYQELSQKASKMERQRLSRPVHFILDEFGNFPMFKNFENMISLSRSRNIWYTMIIQSYRQLDLKYTEPVARIILENSNMQLFFGSNDYKTKKEFSEACGLVAGISEKAYLDGDTANIQHYPIEEFKTVTISDLSKIEPSELYLIAFGMPVMQSKMERYFLVKEFTPLPTSEYRVIDDIEISSPTYTYNISNDMNSISRRKPYTLVYGKEENKNKYDIKELRMITITMALCTRRIIPEMAQFNIQKVSCVFPRYALRAFSLSKDRTEESDVKVEEDELIEYMHKLKNDIVRYYISKKEGDKTGRLEEIKRHFQQDMFSVTSYVRTFFPKELMLVLSDALNYVTYLTQEEFEELLKSIPS